MSDWIKLHRKFEKWEWRSKPEMVSLFIHMLTQANYENKKWQGHEVLRGQVIFGRLKWAEILGISEKSLRTCLERLKSTNEIITKSTNKFTLITIVKYEEYQFSNSESASTENEESASKGPAKGQQRATPKEVKKDNNTITPLPPFVPVTEWEAFKEMRRRIKKPMTPYAEQLAISKLGKFVDAGYDAKEILNKSVLNDYQDIYEPKGKSNENSSRNTTGNTQPTKTDRLKAAARRAAIAGGFAPITSEQSEDDQYALSVLSEPKTIR